MPSQRLHLPSFGRSHHHRLRRSEGRRRFHRRHQPRRHFDRNRRKQLRRQLRTVHRRRRRQLFQRFDQRFELERERAPVATRHDVPEQRSRLRIQSWNSNYVGSRAGCKALRSFR